MTTLGNSQAVDFRSAGDRGRTQLGWLDSRHTFSFGRYRDLDWVGVGPLVVINDDRVAGGGGFETHTHKNMEIVSYVVEGSLEHRDSAGGGSRIGPGGVQVMSAGMGIAHSEFNPSAVEPVRFLQIWIAPDREGHTPSYADAMFAIHDEQDRLHLIVSGDGRDGSLSIHRDVDLWAARVNVGAALVHEPRVGTGERGIWVQVVRGSVRVAPEGEEAVSMGEGDGVSINRAVPLRLEAESEAEVLVFDLPMD